MQGWLVFAPKILVFNYLLAAGLGLLFFPYLMIDDSY